MILALPFPAVVGVVARSPLNVLRGSSAILPVTVRTRCALLTPLVTSTDWLTNVFPSGSGPPLAFLLIVHPETSVTATHRAARTAKCRRGVCRGCIVEG